jgi:hypothetical protein
VPQTVALLTPPVPDVDWSAVFDTGANALVANLALDLSEQYQFSTDDGGTWNDGGALIAGDTEDVSTDVSGQDVLFRARYVDNIIALNPLSDWSATITVAIP